jgi:hypothetical protein
MYELFNLKKSEVVGDDTQTNMRGMALGAVFTSRTRIAVLDNSSQVRASTILIHKYSIHYLQIRVVLFELTVVFACQKRVSLA